MTSDFIGGGDIADFCCARAAIGGVKKWYIGSESGETTIRFVFFDPKIGGNVFFDFIFTIGNPPPLPVGFAHSPQMAILATPRNTRVPITI